MQGQARLLSKAAAQPPGKVCPAAQAKAGAVFRGAPPTQSYLRVSVGVAQGRSPGAAPRATPLLHAEAVPGSATVLPGRKERIRTAPAPPAGSLCLVPGYMPVFVRCPCYIGAAVHRARMA